MSAKSNWSSVVKTIFVNLLFLIGVILIIIGFIGGTSTVVKLVVFDKYPLYTYYEESRCNNYPVAPKIAEDRNEDEVTKEEREQATKECLRGLDNDRKLKIVEDVTNAVSFTVAGLFLTLMFKRFIFEKKK